MITHACGVPPLLATHHTTPCLCPFPQLVEMKDSSSGGNGADAPFPWAGKSYADIYRDVRGAVDLCHRDGSIKREVAANPEK